MKKCLHMRAWITQSCHHLRQQRSKTSLINTKISFKIQPLESILPSESTEHVLRQKRHSVSLFLKKCCVALKTELFFCQFVLWNNYIQQREEKLFIWLLMVKENPGASIIKLITAVIYRFL